MILPLVVSAACTCTLIVTYMSGALQVKDIVDYAARRFITVVPEIELPGHCGAALACYPHLSCEWASTCCPSLEHLEHASEHRTSLRSRPSSSTKLYFLAALQHAGNKNTDVLAQVLRTCRRCQCSGGCMKTFSVRCALAALSCACHPMWSGTTEDNGSAAAYPIASCAALSACDQHCCMTRQRELNAVTACMRCRECCVEYLLEICLLMQGDEETFTFLETVLNEVLELFPSQHIHIGGDEVGNLPDAILGMLPSGFHSCCQPLPLRSWWHLQHLLHLADCSLYYVASAEFSDV